MVRSSELTGGIRASAQAVTAASHLTTNGAAYVQETVVNEVLPRARRMGKVAGRQAHSALSHVISDFFPCIFCLVVVISTVMVVTSISIV